MENFNRRQHHHQSLIPFVWGQLENSNLTANFKSQLNQTSTMEPVNILGCRIYHFWNCIRKVPFHFKSYSDYRERERERERESSTHMQKDRRPNQAWSMSFNNANKFGLTQINFLFERRKLNNALFCKLGENTFQILKILLFCKSVDSHWS